jgi:hypothetical protein
LINALLSTSIGVALVALPNVEVSVNVCGLLLSVLLMDKIMAELPVCMLLATLLLLLLFVFVSGMADTVCIVDGGLGCVATINGLDTGIFMACGLWFLLLLLKWLMRSEQDHQGYMTFFDLKKKIKIFFLLGNWIDSI